MNWYFEKKPLLILKNKRKDKIEKEREDISSNSPQIKEDRKKVV